MIILNFDVVTRLDLSVKRSTTRQVEPELDLVSNLNSLILLGNSFLNLDNGSASGGVDFGNKLLVMAEIVSDEGVRLAIPFSKWLGLCGERLKEEHAGPLEESLQVRVVGLELELAHHFT